MVFTPYERKNEKTIKIAVCAVKAYISKSILPTYVRFSRARSHITSVCMCLHQVYIRVVLMQEGFNDNIQISPQRLKLKLRVGESVHTCSRMYIYSMVCV